MDSFTWEEEKALRDSAIADYKAEADRLVRSIGIKHKELDKLLGLIHLLSGSDYTPDPSRAW